MSLGGRLDDVVFREIFKIVDPSTLVNCRLACRAWNREICRMSRFTRCFKLQSLIIELDESIIRLSNGSPKNWKTFEDSIFTPDCVRNILRHVAPPKILNITLQWDNNEYVYERMIDNINEKWCKGVKELDIVNYSNVRISRVLRDISKFSNLMSFSLSHYCQETISCSQIFQSIKFLRLFRLFGFNNNDGSGESSGLIFDNSAIEVLVKNQRENGRLIQRLELYNTDLTFELDVFLNGLKQLAGINVHEDIKKQPVFKDFQDPEEAESIYILFDNCQWINTKEFNLISSIPFISTDYQLPIQQSDNDNILKGDYRFTISNTKFVLNFIAGR